MGVTVTLIDVMVTLDAAPAPASAALLGEAPPSPAGPAGPEDAGLPLPPMISLPAKLQQLRFSTRQTEFVFGARRRLGEVFRMHSVIEGEPVVTSHPDHIRSLFTAKPDIVPSLTAESPLRPVVGPYAVLTANGKRHLRQRRLLLPPFHGEAIDRYVAMIRDAADLEISSWKPGEVLALAPRMSSITLDVIMAGIFGVEGRPKVGTAEHALRQATKGIIWTSTLPIYQVAELMNVGHEEPVGLTKVGLDLLDRTVYAVIRKRRGVADLDERTDIMSLLMRATTEDGEPLSDRELRDELLTIVLAGHETTANQLAWTWERLVRTPHAHEELLRVVRAGDEEESTAAIDRVLWESQRSRPVIPIVGRRPTVPWRLGDFAVPANWPISMSILLLHHREDLYPDPFAFRPERWVGAKPGTYSWIPYGGGARRCLGATLANAEMRLVMEEVVRRTELEAVDPEPERAVHRNVTMIPERGARVRVVGRR
jgi:cytochrome P450